MPASQLAIHGGPRAVRTPYRERWRRIRWPEALRIARCMLRDQNTLADGSGPIADFERRFAALCGTRYALATNSGTAALHSAYFAVGVGPGTEVIVPAYTFFASATPVLQCGARPVFCDIDGRTLTADPADVEKRITPRTRAICVVHVWGNPAAMDAFVEISRRHGVALVEDASHAQGASYLGRPIGSWGDIGCFSLQGTKAVSGGELGVAVTNDPGHFDRMLALGHCGRTARGQVADTMAIDNMSLGLKFRPHLYAILLAAGSLSRLEELNRRRRRNYRILCEGLAGCEAIRPVESLPGAEPGGLLEFILRYEPEHAGGWNCGAFVHAARAEGVPIAVDRYTRAGSRFRLLHESPLLGAAPDAALPGSELAEGVGGAPGRRPGVPVAEHLADRLVTLPAFTKVPERFVRQCARALRKVTRVAAERSDLRR